MLTDNLNRETLIVTMSVPELLKMIAKHEAALRCIREQQAELAAARGSR